MNIECLACGKKLKLSAKMIQSVEGLEPGKSIKIKCPACSRPVVLDSSSVNNSGAGANRKTKKVAGSKVRPPSPPDITWLKDGVYDEEQVIEDVPLALVLVKPSSAFNTIVESIESIGYKTDVMKSVDEAIEKMQFAEYSAVVLHSSFEGGGVGSSEFHQYMSKLPMSKRRFIYYILVGKEFKTLYGLQALAYSANLVVNDAEVQYFNVIIRKSIPEYEELFGPIMEELQIHGK